jgi:ATP-dependent protease HslVU (ClpYQ) peptidase subunit
MRVLFFTPQVVLMADGQITAGSKVVKPNARKLRRLATEPVPSLGGFAGEQDQKVQVTLHQLGRKCCRCVFVGTEGCAAFQSAALHAPHWC